MPNGGQLSAGSGLRLQPSYPGVQDVGNGNISGVFHASRVTTTDPANDNNNLYSENFGHKNNWIGGADPNVSGVVLLGINNVIAGSVASGSCIGRDSGLSGINSTCIGDQAFASNSTTQTSGCVAIGRLVGANNLASDGGGQPVAMGLSARANNGSVAIGKSITATNDNFVDSDSVAMGRGVTVVNAGVGSSVGLGRGINITHTNELVVGWFGGGIVQPTSAGNAIIIGNPTQKDKVQIGPFDLTNGWSATQRNVADANATITSKDSVLAYSSITAARTVALPAANAVPPGFRVEVVDDSGSASAGNTITVNRAGADTINGAASTVINTAYGYVNLKSDGVSKWTIMGKG